MIQLILSLSILSTLLLAYEVPISIIDYYKTGKREPPFLLIIPTAVLWGLLYYLTTQIK